ncbi:peptidase M28 [Flavobacteriales bacterium 34_180_T64]|nr:peptidase M28 [Flavobacteriales bacterium 34_180_T64]
MNRLFKFTFAIFVLTSSAVLSQNQNQEDVISLIIEEANDNSQLERLAHELLDVVGPRLTGTPQKKHANDWLVAQYEKWGIAANNEQWGEWRGWERGVTHIDMVSPRLQTLKGTQLGWSPSTTKEGITAEVITIPTFLDAIEFEQWLPKVKGKIVLVSRQQPTGRPDYNWEEFATEASFKKMKKERDARKTEWYKNIKRTGYKNTTGIITALEKSGAVGIISSYWSGGFGANKVFTAKTKHVPSLDMNLEDYNMLYRLVDYGNKPQIRIVSESKELGTVPTFNTIAEIRGTETPKEYIILSAHLDSFDGSPGATDNGTGTILMMEVMRILKKMNPNPKRTILAGHWGAEEQGTNGSKAFVEDHPEIIKNIQVVFNQDNGTGRIVNLSGAGFMHSYEFLSRWLTEVPIDISKHIKTEFPGTPVRRGRGSSDNKSFLAADAVTFNLGALDWSYRDYTWHTNVDSYDKIVFDDVRSNVILTAILTYMACEDPNRASRQKAVLPLNPATGKRDLWPKPQSPTRKGGMD